MRSSLVCYGPVGAHSEDVDVVMFEGDLGEYVQAAGVGLYLFDCICPLRGDDDLLSSYEVVGGCGAPFFLLAGEVRSPAV